MGDRNGVRIAMVVCGYHGFVGRVQSSKTRSAYTQSTEEGGIKVSRVGRNNEECTMFVQCKIASQWAVT